MRQEFRSLLSKECRTDSGPSFLLTLYTCIARGQRGYMLRLPVALDHMNDEESGGQFQR